MSRARRRSRGVVQGGGGELVTERMITTEKQLPEHWTVGELLNWTEDYFARLRLDSPRLDAEILLAEAIGCTRLELYTGFRRFVDPEERGRYRELVARRARREPVAYIVGRREFYSLVFEVDASVLVPRPETEHVVECALEELANRSTGARLLDLGTGCGNIVVSVLVNSVDCTADAVDQSPAAVAVARRNAAAHSVADRIRFHTGDLCAALPPSQRSYDVVVSNPPYVTELEYPHLMPDVRQYEPREALVDTKSDAGDGLGFYREIASSLRPHMASGGVLVLEVGEGQSEAVAALLQQAFWKVRGGRDDLSGVRRVLLAEM